MKLISVFALLLVMAGALLANPETSEYKAASNQFKTLYNSGQHDGIFEMFSDIMKGAFPIDKTREFLQNLNTQLGSINDMEFMDYDNQSNAVYKTTFEAGTFSIRILLDNNSMINRFLLDPYTDESLPKIDRNITKMMLPSNEEWTVIWGGDTKELNYHVESKAQKNAFDLVITDVTGKSFKTDGKHNEDYYAFGKELIAPCDGEIVLSVDGIKDNTPGKMNPFYALGNSVVIKTANDEYLFLAHFKQNSIRVKEGQKVKKGDILGQCGNSGNSSEAHIHFHIQNVEDMTIATGVKCYFDEIIVNGELKKDYSPIKNEKIRNK